MKGKNIQVNLVEEIIEAEKRIRKFIRTTPLEYSIYLSKNRQTKVYLKLENIQRTGSFKLRGALNKFLSLTKKEKERGVISASSGNHGSALAYVLKKFNYNGKIYLPEYASSAKVQLLEKYGVDIEFYGSDCVQTELYARKIAEQTGKVFISPYNDIKIIGGQGTIGIELEKQLPEVNTVFVPIGGGGLISGITGFLKHKNKKINIIGCLPENSPVMYESIKAGKIIKMSSKPTLSDGTAGQIEEGSITFDICKKLVDDYILLSEKEIKNAILFIMEKHNFLIEGSGALSVAAFLKYRKKLKGKNIVLIISGAKISLPTLKEILTKKQ